MKHGFRVMDSDLHTMEPDGLWETYLEEPFRKFAPSFVRREQNASNQPLIRIGGIEIGEMSGARRAPWSARISSGALGQLCQALQAERGALSQGRDDGTAGAGRVTIANEVRRSSLSTWGRDRRSARRRSGATTVVCWRRSPYRRSTTTSTVLSPAK